MCCVLYINVVDANFASTTEKTIIKMKYRKPNRLKYYDYSNGGWYYITICTQDHKNLFGKIIKDKMILNNSGKIVDECWKKIAQLHKNIELDFYVIMPNHIHGIIIINYVIEDAKFASSTYDRTKMQLSKLIQQFKRSVTLRIKAVKPGLKFKWQRSFYDRIIRNEKELFNIRKYIQQNPLKWNLEKGTINLDVNDITL
jgi:REP-associated tyrosine transposase